MIKQIEATLLPDKKDFKEKISELDKYINETKLKLDSRAALMGVLHKVQTIFGYIPTEAMDFVSQKLSVPTAHIYGMATFYNFFSLKPKARYQICVCKGTACYVSGGARILEKLKSELNLEEGDITKDSLFGLSITRCLGCCGLSPVMQVNDDVYVRMAPEKVPGILKKYRLQGAKSTQPKKANNR